MLSGPKLKKLHHAPILNHITLRHLVVGYQQAVGTDVEALHVSHPDTSGQLPSSARKT
jgi:hypothetical protein